MYTRRNNTRRNNWLIVGAVLGILVLLALCAGLAYAAYAAWPKGPVTPPASTPAVLETPGYRETPISPSGNCPTDAQMQDAHGFTARGIKPVFTGGGIAWEGCKWTLQAYGGGKFTDVPLLPDWQYTLTKLDGTVAVYYGAPGFRMDILGATFRYRPFYNTPDNKWVSDPCELLRREVAFGQGRNPAYNTENGNVSCTFVPSSAPATTSCLKDATDAASKIGGDARYWTLPDWGGGAWVFKNKNTFYTLRYPGFGRLDVWIEGPVSVTSANANVLEGKKFDEASFHCK
jgi:hypothetical protein